MFFFMHDFINNTIEFNQLCNQNDLEKTPWPDYVLNTSGQSIRHVFNGFKFMFINSNICI